MTTEHDQTVNDSTDPDAHLTPEQYAAVLRALGLPPETPWDVFSTFLTGAWQAHLSTAQEIMENITDRIEEAAAREANREKPGRIEIEGTAEQMERALRAMRGGEATTKRGAMYSPLRSALRDIERMKRQASVSAKMPSMFNAVLASMDTDEYDGECDIRWNAEGGRLRVLVARRVDIEADNDVACGVTPLIDLTINVPPRPTEDRGTARPDFGAHFPDEDVRFTAGDDGTTDHDHGIGEVGEVGEA